MRTRNLHSGYVLWQQRRRNKLIELRDWNAIVHLLWIIHLIIIQHTTIAVSAII